MSDTAHANPKGLFDRTTKGRTTLSIPVEVERGRIRFFAQVLGEPDPIHADPSAARAAGHPDVVAPASFFMVIEALANEELERRGEAGALQLVGSDFRYLLHGDEHYAYHGLIYAGDTVSFATEVVDFYDKKGGAMEFVTLRATVTHPERGVLVEATRNLLHRLG